MMWLMELKNKEHLFDSHVCVSTECTIICDLCGKSQCIKELDPEYRPKRVVGIGHVCLECFNKNMLQN